VVIYDNFKSAVLKLWYAYHLWYANAFKVVREYRIGLLRFVYLYKNIFVAMFLILIEFC